MQFLTNIDLNNNELQNAVIQNLAVAPSAAKAGQLYFNSTDNLLYQYNGSKWNAVGKPLEKASATVLGGIKVGAGLSIAEDGKLSATGSVTPDNVKWATIKDHPTTVAGYGITDLKIEGSKVTIGANSISNLVSDASYVHTDKNFTEAYETKLKGIETGAEKNIIEIIKVNSAKQSVSPTDRSVDIKVPTTTEELTNNSNFITAAGAPVQSVNSKTGAVTLTAEDVKALPINGSSAMTGDLPMGSHKITGLAAGVANTDAVTKKQLDDAITGIGTVFNFKGSKPSKSNLPPSGNTIGDVWYVEDEQVGYIWIKDSGSEGRWEQLGPAIDLSGYVTKAGLAKSTGSATDNAMTQKATTDALNLKADKTTVNAIPVVKIKTGSIATNQVTVSIAYTGKVINTFVTDATTNELVMTDVIIASNNVKFNVASSPEHTLTCTVVYI